MSALITLDLGKNTFKALEVVQDGKDLVLQKYNQADSCGIDIETLTADSDIQSYVQGLKQFIADSNFTGRFISVALPEQFIFMRVIAVPKMSDKDLASSIKFEAEQYIPLPLKDVTFSYNKAGDDLADPNKMNIQIVAAKKALLNKFVAILKGVVLIPKILEPEALSLGRALGDSPTKPQARMIVNIGFSSTLLVVSYRGYVVFTRTFALGGDTLTRAIAQKLNLDYSQAEEYKKAYGLDNTQVEGKIFDALKPAFDNLITEIKRSLIFFTRHNNGVTISKVIISGGTAQMPGFLLYIINNLGDVEVELANPWKTIKLSSKLQTNRDLLISNGPIFATCAGLSLKETKLYA